MALHTGKLLPRIILDNTNKLKARVGEGLARTDSSHVPEEPRPYGPTRQIGRQEELCYETPH